MSDDDEGPSTARMAGPASHLRVEVPGLSALVPPPVHRWPYGYRARLALAAIACAAIGSAPSLAQQAVPPCPEGDYSVELEGGIAIQASELESSDDLSVFLAACVDVRGWTIRAPRIEVVEDRLSVRGAEVAGPGVSGTLEALAGTGTRVTATGARLVVVVNGAESIAGHSLPRGKYRAAAKEAVLEGATLSLREAVFDRLDAAGEAVERYRAGKATIGAEGVTVSGFGYATSTLGLTSRSAQVQDEGATLQDVRVTVSRDQSVDGIGFTAERAFLPVDDAATPRFEGIGLHAYGIDLPPLPIGPVEYDPRKPLRLPYRVLLGDGLTVGVADFQPPGTSGARLTLLAHRVFTARPSLSFAVNASREQASISVSQPLDEPLAFRVGLEPPTGLVFGTGVSTGRRVADPEFSRPAAAEASAGYAYSTSLGPLQARARVDAGRAFQQESAPTAEDAASQRQELVFGRAQLSASTGFQAGGFSFSASGSAVLTYYAAGTNYQGGLAAGATAYLVAAYSSVPFGASISLAYGQQFLPTPIRFHAVANQTMLTGVASLHPVIPTPPLGFVGLAVANPRLEASFTVDLRDLQVGSAGAWDSLLLAGGIDLSYYEGRVSRDFLDRPFQTPRLTLRPQARYDFASKTGEAGADVTYYDCCLGITGGLYRTFAPAGDAWRVGFGLRLR